MDSLLEKEGEKKSFIESKYFPLTLLLSGLLLIGLGILISRFLEIQKSPEVQILSADTSVSNSFVVVEIAGEVIKPGVYKLPIDSRVNDLLTIAGGFTADADREYVEKNINLAAKLVDGGKIYIPKKGGLWVVSSGSGVSSGGGDKINMNTATISELDTLWGIGEATARKIIESRPYQKIEELLEKKIVNESVWRQIKDKIAVF